MTAPANYHHVVTLLARKLVQLDSSQYDPPIGLDLFARLEINRQRVELWATVEAVGLRDAVRQRIALVGPALLREAS